MVIQKKKSTKIRKKHKRKNKHPGAPLSCADKALEVANRICEAIDHDISRAVSEESFSRVLSLISSQLPFVIADRVIEHLSFFIKKREDTDLASNFSMLFLIRHMQRLRKQLHIWEEGEHSFAKLENIQLASDEQSFVINPSGFHHKPNQVNTKETPIFQRIAFRGKETLQSSISIDKQFIHLYKVAIKKGWRGVRLMALITDIVSFKSWAALLQVMSQLLHTHHRANLLDGHLLQSFQKVQVVVEKEIERYWCKYFLVLLYPFAAAKEE